MLMEQSNGEYVREYELAPDRGGNWWGWLPMVILAWALFLFFVIAPYDPKRFSWDAKILAMFGTAVGVIATTRCFWFDIYRNPKKIYISDEGIGWDSFKRSFFVKWEDVTKVRRELWATYGLKLCFKVHPKRLYVWDFFDDYEDLKSEIKRRALNAKVTIK